MSVSSSTENFHTFLTTIDSSTALSLHVRHKDILYLANPVSSTVSISPLEAESVYLTSVCVNPLLPSSTLSIEYGLSNSLPNYAQASSLLQSSSNKNYSSKEGITVPKSIILPRFTHIIPIPYNSIRTANGITVNCDYLLQNHNLPLTFRTLFIQQLNYLLDNCPVTIGSTIRIPWMDEDDNDDDQPKEGNGNLSVKYTKATTVLSSSSSLRTKNTLCIEITRTNPTVPSLASLISSTYNSGNQSKKSLFANSIASSILRVVGGQTRISFEQDIQNKLLANSPLLQSPGSSVPVNTSTKSLPGTGNTALSSSLATLASSKESLLALSPWKTGGKIEYKRPVTSTTDAAVPSSVSSLSSTASSSSFAITAPPVSLPPAPSVSLMDNLKELMLPRSTNSSSWIAGLEEPLQLLREMVILPILYPEILASMGLEIPKGLLLYGPPGCGKTLLVSSIVNEANEALGYDRIQLFTVQGPEILSPVMGESEEKLRRIFTAAENHSVKSEGISIIFFDEIDALCPRRFNAQGKVATMGTTSLSVSRIVTQLLTLMDGLRTVNVPSFELFADAETSLSNGVSVPPRVPRIVVIAATNRIDSLDLALRRPGRFDREIRIDPPNVESRLRILQLHTQKLRLDDKLIEDNYLSTLANKSIGYVGADLLALCREANGIAMKRYLDQQKKYTQSSPLSLTIVPEDFEQALTLVGPSALRGYMNPANEEYSKLITWEMIGGMNEVIQRLREAVEYPLQFTTLYQQMRLHSPRGILLYGPPGNSKTTLVKALANAVNASFFSLSSAEIISPYVGEAERLLRLLFTRAREASPSLIFLDEIDALVGKRGIGGESSVSQKDTSLGLLATLLTEMDGIVSTGNVIIIAATNRPEVLDPALTRPGRFEIRIPVPSPTETGRYEILQIHCRTMRLDTDVSLQYWAQKEYTDGWSGAQLENLCREAAMEALRENISAVTVHQHHFAGAWKALRSSSENGK